MRVGLVHDWLDRTMGGAERVLLELLDLFPDAPVHTLLYDGSVNGLRVPPDRVRTSWLQRLPTSVQNRQRYLLPLIPSAVERLDLTPYDVVVSSSAAFVKNVRVPAGSIHLCYCHSPMRFVWDYWPRYLEEQRVGPAREAAIRLMVARLRVWDYCGSASVDRFVANSKTTQRRLRTYYGVDSRIVHPPVDVASFTPLGAHEKGDFCATLATLTPYKRIDVAVRAFTAAQRALVVIGDGPERAHLERLAGPTIRFVGHVDDAERARLLARARALVFPNEEDFGIAPVEAMASGTPVVALARGGATETLEDGVTGVLFEGDTPEALIGAVEALERLEVRAEALVDRARRFDRAVFRRAMRAAVREAWESHVTPD